MRASAHEGTSVEATNGSKVSCQGCLGHLHMLLDKRPVLPVCRKVLMRVGAKEQATPASRISRQGAAEFAGPATLHIPPAAVQNSREQGECWPSWRAHGTLPPLQPLHLVDSPAWTLHHELP